MLPVWSIECTSFWEGRGGKGLRSRFSGPSNTYPSVFGLDFGDFAILLTHDAHEGVEICYFEDGQPPSRSISGDYTGYSMTLVNYLPGQRKNKKGNDMLVVQLRRTKEAVENMRTVFRNWQRVPYNQLFATVEAMVPRRLLPKYYRNPVV